MALCKFNCAPSTAGSTSSTGVGTSSSARSNASANLLSASSASTAASGSSSSSGSANGGNQPIFKLNWMQWSEQGDHWDILDSKMTYCDVTLACADGCLSAHSSILSLDSFFVKNLLKDVTPGALLGGMSGVVIHLPDWSKSVVRQLLCILYNGCAYVSTASDSAKVSKLGRMLGYNVHKWQLLPNTPSDKRATPPPQIPSPIRNLAATGTTISVLKRPPPSLHPVGSLAAAQGIKLSKFLAEKQQQLNNRNNSSSSAGSNNGVETLAETSSVTISRIPCVNQGNQHHHHNSGNQTAASGKTGAKTLIASSASAGCQTVNFPPAAASSAKDPLSLTPSANSSSTGHPSVPTIRVKSGLKMLPGLTARLMTDGESAVTLTPSASSNPPGLCKINPSSSSAAMVSTGVTANSRPLQDILSSCGRVLTVRNVSGSASGAGTGTTSSGTTATRILLPTVVNKATMISDAPKILTPKQIGSGRSGPASNPPPLILAHGSLPPPLLVQNRNSHAGQQRLQAQLQHSNKQRVEDQQENNDDDDDEQLSLDSMLDCMIKEETLDDEEFIDESEEEETAAAAAATSRQQQHASQTSVATANSGKQKSNAAESVAARINNGSRGQLVVIPAPPSDEPPALIVHPPQSSSAASIVTAVSTAAAATTTATGKITWNHPDPGGWKGKDQSAAGAKTGKESSGVAAAPSSAPETSSSTTTTAAAGTPSGATGSDQNEKAAAAQGKRRGRKRRRLSRKRKPIKIKIRAIGKDGGGGSGGGDDAADGGAEGDKDGEDGGRDKDREQDGEEEDDEEAEAESEYEPEPEQNDDSDEDWELNASGTGGGPKGGGKRKPSAERRSPRLRITKGKGKGKDGSGEKPGDVEDVSVVEDALDASDTESVEDDEEVEEEMNPNIAKISLGACYDSFKDFQVAFQRYCAENFACMKMIRRHLLQGHGDKFPVHEITYSCGAIKRRRGETNPAQQCPAMLHCKFNATWKKYVIAKLDQTHSNHAVTRNAYDDYMKKKELTTHEKKVALRLLATGKDAETVCKIMNRITGKTISVEYLTTLNF